ncbi:MAG: helix-hairpin-helix domain-containing protein [Salibacteraceae bacterium]|nr:helix-hairpin-helix domain-containing protein [Salibacteraceae bacterium]
MSNTSKVNFIQQASKLSNKHIKNCVDLIEDGGTIPFIARYRKDSTGGMNEVEIESVHTQLSIWNKLEERKKTILKNLEEQNVITVELKTKIVECYNLIALEDLFLPFKKKTKTKAAIALEAGLKPLAVAIMKESDNDPVHFAKKLISSKFPTEQATMQGAIDIAADWINNNEWIRNRLRRIFNSKALISSKLIKGKDIEAEKFSDFFDYSESVNRIKPHRFMALRRGKNLGVLAIGIVPLKADSIAAMEHALVKSKTLYSTLLKKAIVQAYSKQLKPALEREVFNRLSETSDRSAVTIFRKNLEQILMTAPLRNKKILAIDPGFKSGCKLVCLDENGALKHNETIYPNAPQFDSKALNKINTLVRSYKIDAIAIGNGTASRETEQLIQKIRFDRDIQVFVVSEAGASVYSASRIARAEFPNYDVTVRGSVSIGRRLIDPLSELVKIEPKALGVGQYQHDIPLIQLESGLSRSIEYCVNKVGVDINTSSAHLLTYVSGIGPKMAESIVSFRNEKSTFQSKKDILKVSGLGQKAFEQCAGFIRISNAKNPLDNSAIHPESYNVVKSISEKLNLTTNELLGNKDILQTLNAEDFVTEKTGIETISFILMELEKPNRDPRETAKIFQFRKDIKTINDLKVGDIVPGIVSNVTGFGAFVDIGIKENGLLHLSEMADKYVSDPNDIVSMNQTIEAKVKSIDLERKRIALSLKGVS